MRTVQMTLDDDLVKLVDKAARRLRTSRSGFARRAFREALHRLAALDLEAAHRRGYAAKPVTADEFSVWEDEQAWPD